MGVSDDVSGVDEDSGSRAAARLQPVRRTLTNGNFERMDPNDGGRDALHQAPDAVAESAQGIGLRSRLVGKNQTKEQAGPYHDAGSVHVKIGTWLKIFGTGSRWNPVGSRHRRSNSGSPPFAGWRTRPPAAVALKAPRGPADGGDGVRMTGSEAQTLGPKIRCF